MFLYVTSLLFPSHLVALAFGSHLTQCLAGPQGKGMGCLKDKEMLRNGDKKSMNM